LSEQAIAYRGQGENIEQEIKGRGKRETSKGEVPRIFSPVVVRDDIIWVYDRA
jgi:hypothetical protein